LTVHSNDRLTQQQKVAIVTLATTVQHDRERTCYVRHSNVDANKPEICSVAQRKYSLAELTVIYMNYVADC